VDPDVAIVGGGVAGLSAASALAERGARVLVVEARPALGGRVTSYTDPATGQRADNGQHVLMGCYDETFAFLRRVGSSGLVYVQPQLSIDVQDAVGEASRLHCPDLPTPLHLLAGLAGWGALGLGDRLSAVRLALRRRPSPSETVATWLDGLGQSRRLVEMLWEPLAIAALNQPIDVAAALPFAEVLDRMLTTRSGASLALPSAPLADVFAAPARAYIEANGGHISTGARARVCLDGAGPAVEIAGRRQAARAVVVATEWHALGGVFSGATGPLEAMLRDAAATPAAAIVSAHVWLDRAVMDVPLLGLPGRPWQWIFDVGAAWTGARTGTARHVSLVASAADGLASSSNAALEGSALEVLRASVARVRDAKVARVGIVRERRATFSVAPGSPPRPGNATAVPGLFLAGDWIGNPLPATIEAAATSGHQAADLVSRYLKL
jgi:squalene-associated FAD-dependent desaturase